MRTQAFKDEFNNQAIAMGAALKSVSCCFFRAMNPCALAASALMAEEPGADGYSEAQLAQGVKKAVKNPNLGTFALPLLKLANANAVAITRAREPA